MNRHAASYTAYPRGDSGTFSISPHKFQPRSHHGPRRRIQYIKYLVIAVCSIFTLSFLFPSFRSAASLGLYSHPETFPVETIRYYDLSDVQGTAKGWDREERVLLCTPLRDAEPHLSMFFSHLRNFTYPHHMIDLAFLVSDSKDNTMGLLTNLLHGLQDDPDPKMPYGEISVIGKDFGQKVNQDVESRHGFAAQAGRRKLMAQARNWLLSAALRPYHSWVYWRDADVETCPFTILEDLMRHNKDVIVPNVWRPLPDWLGGEQPYDLNSWQESETALALADTLDEDAVIVEGYAEYATWRPHLAYLRDPYGDPDMEMDLDGVGGVSILAKAKVFRSGVHFPAFSFEKHAETEGFGKMAKRMKFTVTGLPHYTIWHLYEPSVDDIRHMEEMEAERKARENEEKERAERMKKLKEEYKDTNSQWETDKKDIQNIAMKEKEQKHAEKVAEMQKLAGQPAAAQPAKWKVEHTQTKEQLAKNAALKEQATEHEATKPKATEDDEDTEPTKHKATKPEVADDHEDTGGTKLKAAKPKPQVTENDEDTEPTKQKATKPKPKVAEDDEDAEPKGKYSNAKTIPGTESKAKPISEHDSKIKAAAAQDPNVKKEAAEKYAKAKAAPEKEET